MGIVPGCGSGESVVYKEMSDEVEEQQAEPVKVSGDSPSPQSVPPDAQTPPSAVAKTVLPDDQLDPASSPERTVKMSAGETSATPEKTNPASGEAVTAPAERVHSGELRETTASPRLIPAGSGRNALSQRLSPQVPPEEPILEPRTPKLLIPEKTFRQEGPDGAIRVTFDDIDLLKVLNMEPVPENAVEQFPAWLKQLDGQRVLIRGFMFPTLTQTGITYFQHVRDNEICCFGRTPKVYDRISTILRPGKTTNYIQGRPFDVIGILRIDPVYEDGEWLQLYLLEDAIVLD